MRRAWLLAAGLSGAIAAAAPHEAVAYRPFDATDAAVVERGGLEVEFGPAQWLRGPPNSSLAVPALILNFGFAEERAIGRIQSGLVGLIWQARPTLALDSGIRRTLGDGMATTEIRAGSPGAFS